MKLDTRTVTNTTYALELTEQEATDLRSLLGSIAGDSDERTRTGRPLWRALRNAGVSGRFISAHSRS